MRKNVLAIFIAIMMLAFGITANAANQFSLTGVEDTYAADYAENLEFSLDVDSISTDYEATAIAGIEIKVTFDKSVLAYSKRTSGDITNGEDTVITFSTTSKANANNYGYLVSTWSNQDDPYDDTYNVAKGSSGTFINYVFTRIGTGETTVKVEYISFTDLEGNLIEKIENPCEKTITFGSDEEVFKIADTATSVESTDTMKVKDEETGELKDGETAAGDEVVAIFAKNVTGAELAAESYGIIFGGRRYPGIAAVSAGASWAVKLVGSSTQLPAGNYAYGVYAGDAVVMSDSAWVID